LVVLWLYGFWQSMKYKKGWERLGPQPFKVIVVISMAMHSAPRAAAEGLLNT